MEREGGPRAARGVAHAPDVGVLCAARLSGRSGPRSVGTSTRVGIGPRLRPVTLVQRPQSQLPALGKNGVGAAGGTPSRTPQTTARLRTRKRWAPRAQINVGARPGA